MIEIIYFDFMQGPENDVIVIKPLRAENAPSVATTDPGQLATEKKEALQTVILFDFEMSLELKCYLVLKLF